MHVRIRVHSLGGGRKGGENQKHHLVSFLPLPRAGAEFGKAHFLATTHLTSSFVRRGFPMFFQNSGSASLAS
jgi:hypothetical protein